jgi:hypothetical protein
VPTHPLLAPNSGLDTSPVQCPRAGSCQGAGVEQTGHGGFHNLPSFVYGFLRIGLAPATLVRPNATYSGDDSGASRWHSVVWLQVATLGLS